ncbi:universal stress protein [Dactylosporangium sp. NPDC050688]|uniref:universal stress protein n=1 Tax=Dactylosporangium sp. NPDC050688 TaxID=3157217 RepID=UPI0033C127C1
MTSRDRIVVGVDGTEGARHALRWAIAEGLRTGVPVAAVTAWTWDAALPAGAGPRVERELAELVCRYELARFPAGGASVSVVEGDPVPVLLAAARHARLLVLGSHGHGRLRRALLGSTSRRCARHASCPVVVVPLPQRQPIDNVHRIARRY